MKYEPELRFEDYKEKQAWNSILINDVGCFFNGLSGKTKEDFENGNEPYVSYISIFENSQINESNLGEKDLVHIDEKERQNKVEYGDILFTQSSETVLEVGMSSVWMGKKASPYLNSFCFGLKPHMNCHDSVFLGYLLRSEGARKSIIKEGQGSTRFNLSPSRLGKCMLNVPEVEEQAKIGTFFSLLDKRITLQQEKVDSLMEYKKGLLQQVMNRELRFRDDKGNEYPEWEERKLGSLGTVTSCKRVHASDWTNEGIPFYRAREIVALYEGNPIEPLYISLELYNQFSAISGKINEGDLLLTGVGSIGVPYLVRKDDKFYFKDGNIIWFKNDGKINGEFLFQLFGTKFIGNQIKNMSGKGTVSTYTIDNAKNTVVYYPCIEEQQKIATLFSALDQKIEKEKEKLELIREMKKGYMQKMFV